MFTGWFSSNPQHHFPPAPDPALLQAACLREHTAEQLRREARHFFDDDANRGRRVIDAALALVDALAEQRRRLGVDDSHVELVDAVVSLVRMHEGGAVLERRRRFDEALARWSDRDDSLPLTPAPDLSLEQRIVDVWRHHIDTVTRRRAVVTVSTSHSTLAQSQYNEWRRRAAAATLSNDDDTLRSMDVRYSVYEDDDSFDADDGDRQEVDHSSYAQLALAALGDAIAAHGQEKTIIDVALDVSLAPTPSHNVSACCSLAFRVHTKHAGIEVVGGDECFHDNSAANE